MADDFDRKFDAIFDKHKAIEAEKQLKLTTAEDKAAIFLKSFEELQERLIRPEFEKIGKRIAARGYGYKISTRPSIEGRGFEKQPAWIRLTIFDSPEGRAEDTGYPGVAVACDKRAQKLDFHSSTIGPNHGGQAGGSGTYTLEQVTPELIQAQVLRVLSEVFG